MSDGRPLAPAKAVLRQTLNAARAAFVAGLDAAERRQLETRLAAQLAAQLTAGQRVAAYAAFGSEIDPARLALPRPALLPRIAGRGLPLTFHDSSAAALVANRFGMAEPPAGLPAVDPDIVLVPLLGVDRRGYRIGYGGGYYDRTLAALRQRRRIFAIGCAWDCQLIERIPAEAWDEPLDAIATPTRFIRIAVSWVND